MSDENRFQYSKSDTLEDVMLLNASMSNFSYGKHSHEQFSFGVTLNGRQDFFALGQYHKSHPGNVIVFNPDDAHDGSPGDNQTLEYKMLYVPPEQLSPAFGALGIKNPNQFRVKETVIHNNSVKGQILRVAALIDSEGTTQSEYELALFELAEQLVYLQEQSVIPPSFRTNSLLERAKEYLQDNFTRDVALDELCQIACMSKYHFLRCFKAYTGMTPHQYWLNIRINRARQALKLGITVSEIASQMGFNDLSHFNRRFKPVFGMTPFQYQRLLLAR